MSRWYQKTVVLSEKPRGIHLITREVLEGLPEIAAIRVGLLHVFLQHTSASITINENASPDVRADLERFLRHLVPDGYNDFAHTIEGPDDMPAHVKAALVGNSLTIPVKDGRVALGTWQGIYLCEHRDRGGQRRIVITLTGEEL